MVEFVKNSKSDMAKDILHLSNSNDFTKYCIGEILASFRIGLNSAFYKISL